MFMCKTVHVCSPVLYGRGKGFRFLSLLLLTYFVIMTDILAQQFPDMTYLPVQEHAFTTDDRYAVIGGESEGRWRDIWSVFHSILSCHMLTKGKACDGSQCDVCCPGQANPLQRFTRYHSDLSFCCAWRTAAAAVASEWIVRGTSWSTSRLTHMALDSHASRTDTSKVADECTPLGPDVCLYSKLHLWLLAGERSSHLDLTLMFIQQQYDV